MVERPASPGSTDRSRRRRRASAAIASRTFRQGGPFRIRTGVSRPAVGFGSSLRQPEGALVPWSGPGRTTCAIDDLAIPGMEDRSDLAAVSVLQNHGPRHGMMITDRFVKISREGEARMARSRDGVTKRYGEFSGEEFTLDVADGEFVVSGRTVRFAARRRRRASWRVSPSRHGGVRMGGARLSRRPWSAMQDWCSELRALPSPHGGAEKTSPSVEMRKVAARDGRPHSELRLVRLRALGDRLQRSGPAASSSAWRWRERGSFRAGRAA